MHSLGILFTRGWSGDHQDRVVILRETPKRYEVTPAEGKPIKLGGRNRWLYPGQTALVPRAALKTHKDPSDG